MIYVIYHKSLSNYTSAKQEGPKQHTDKWDMGNAP